MARRPPRSARRRPRRSVVDDGRIELGAVQRRAASEAEGRAPHWRFKLDHDQPIVWTDLIRGEQRFDPKLLSDPVIRRADGSWLYMLPSVIDDIDTADGAVGTSAALSRALLFSTRCSRVAPA